jgi:hypothetical protein
MRPGSKWLDHQLRLYQVTKTDGEWVFYQRLSDAAEFSCLQNAFFQRFSRMTNY